MSSLPPLLRLEELLVVSPILFLGCLIFYGIFYLAEYFDSPVVFLVLIIPAGALYIIGFLIIIIHIRKKK